MIGQCGDLTVKLQQLKVLMFEYLLNNKILVCYMLQTTNNKNWYINNLKKSTNNKNCNKQFKKSIDTIKIGKSTNNLTKIL